MPDVKANILIVDDRPDKLLSLEAVLEDLGENVVTAASGREALRHVLTTDFAVILLDVNMPGMDGFETASLIRQRKRSEHTPIIFITAFGDEMHAARGYMLGAVDYILAPIMADVLRTKVAVFVDLAKKTGQIKRQAEKITRRAEQLQMLAAASLAINSATAMEQTLQKIADTARDIVGSHQAVTLYVLDARGGVPADAPDVPAVGHTLVSFSEKYAVWTNRPLDLARCANTQIGRSRESVRLTQGELYAHPDWTVVKALNLPPIRGVLAAPLMTRDGRRMGLVYLTDKNDGGDFSADDEAILVQLTQMGSVAIENILFSKEREANRIKDEFLATLSHELRTPLNAIIGWTNILQMDALPAEVAHGLEVIDRNAKSQAKLIEDLLDVSRITTGKLRLKLQDTNLGKIVAAATEALRPNADAKRIALTVDELPPTALVNGDPDRLEQVIWNLLTNAIKFTPAGGQVRLRLTTEGDLFRVDVADTGAGIDPAFLPYVFDRFRQADSTSTRSFGGLGIGLTIVRHIVEMHGGSVEAISPGPGRGSTFTVRLPARSTAGAPTHVNGTDQNAHLHAGQTNGGHASPPDGPSLDEISVLVIDDEADAREVVATILRRAGASVTTSSGAGEALALLGQSQFDVVVSDIAMPELDGFALICGVRESVAFDGESIPAIALTAYARPEDRARTLAAGFDAHLEKPVVASNLIATIARFARTGREVAVSQLVSE